MTIWNWNSDAIKDEVRNYLANYPEEIVTIFGELRQLICESVPQDVEETLWAKLPSYYVADNFVRLIPFRDHINVEAAAILFHRDELAGYKLTPKGMLQITLKQPIPREILKQIFLETLMR